MPSSNIEAERENLEKAIAAQETLRGVLEDTIIDSTIQTLREKLAALVPHPQQQRKLATILFMDIAGHTALTGDLDPEEQMAVVDPAVARLAQKVNDHGGHVTRYQGDGFKAVFGMPVARENDPEQAIRTGLAILQEAEAVAADLLENHGLPNFQVRVGISTGMIFSGGETEGEDTIKGAAVNLAARLERAAEPGTLLISRDTFSHVQGIFDVQPLPAVHTKGFADPVPVFRVLRVKAQPFYRSRRGVEGIETRMIGRDLEFQQLQKVFLEVLEDRELQMVTIMGEAGLGKSRLLYEFENWVDLQPERIRLYKGRAHMETQGLPFSLLRDLLAFRFNIQDDDPSETVRQKLARGLGEFAANNEQAARETRVIGHFLGYEFQEAGGLSDIPDNPQQLHELALNYLGRYFQAAAAHTPVLLVLEDLHWADDGSLDLINQLVFMFKAQPILIAGAARHSLLERRAHWGEGQPFHLRLELRPLSKRDSRSLVDEVLQRIPEVPMSLEKLLVDNAEGNPFYVEELVKMLVEKGIILTGEPHWRLTEKGLEDLQLPPTLMGVLQARLDSLPAEEKTVLQQASVVGRVFWDRVLAHIHTQAGQARPPEGIVPLLDALRGRELVFRRETSTFAEAREHIFKHALLRDVTYESVLISVRKSYHALVADWLVTHAGDRVGELTGLIADHLERAGDLEAARKYLLQAGKEAAASFANDEAIQNFTRALALTPDQSYREKYAVLRERERVLDLISEKPAQEKDLLVLETLAEQLNEAELKFETALRRANFAERIEHHETSLQSAEQAITLAKEVGAPEMIVEGYLASGRARWRLKDLKAARTELEIALLLARDANQNHLEGHILRNLGVIASDKLAYEESTAYYEQSLELYERIGDQIGLCMTLNNIGVVYHRQGDFERSFEILNQSLAITREIGYLQIESMALLNLGINYFELGRFEEARDLQEQARRINHSTGNKSSEWLNIFFLCWIADINDQDYEGQKALANESLAIAKVLQEDHLQAHSLNLLGEALLGLNRIDEAQAAFQQSLEISVKNRYPKWKILASAGLVKAELQRGAVQRAQEQADPIMERLAEIDSWDEPHFGKILFLAASYAALRSLSDARADQVLEEAYFLLQEFAEKITTREHQRQFLENIPWHREIIERWEANQHK